MATRKKMKLTSAKDSLLLSETISEPVLSRDCRRDSGDSSDSGSNESSNMDSDIIIEDELGLQINSDPEVLDDDDDDDDSDENEKDDSVIENDVEDENDEKSMGDPGWADAIRKILNSKKPKGKSTIVLSKAKKLPDVAHKMLKKDPGFEIEGEIKDEKPDPEELDVKCKNSILESRIKKKEGDKKNRLKPSILDRNREKALSKIATKGVVQLFNVVRQQQRTIKTQLQEVKGSTKRDAVMKSIDRRAFLNILMGSGAKSEVIDNPVKTEPEIEVKEESTTWQVLRDDFMMGAKLKDWDKSNCNDNMDDGADSGTGSESDDTTT